MFLNQAGEFAHLLKAKTHNQKYKEVLKALGFYSHDGRF